MGIIYHIYSNHGKGGPVDYSSPLASTAALSYAIGPLDVASSYAFAVRASDADSGLEEANTEARVRFDLDPQGSDVTGRPGPPHAVSMVASAGGGCRVAWAFFPDGGGAAPTSFLVTLSAGAGVVASRTVPYQTVRPGGACVFAGPLEPANYAASVSALGASGLASPAVTVSGHLGLSSAPFVMDSLDIR